MEVGTDPVLDDDVSAVAGLHVAGPVRVLALRTGPSVLRGAISGPQRPDVGERLAALAPELRPDNEPHLVTAFLARLEDRHGLADAAGTTALIVEEATERLRCWAASRTWATLHVVPPNLSWARVARVACLLAGAREPGAASVAALRDGVDAHRPGAELSWVYAP